MNKYLALAISLVFSALLGVSHLLVGNIQYRKLVDDLSATLEKNTEITLTQAAATLRNDLLMYNLRGARNSLEKLKGQELFSEYSIEPLDGSAESSSSFRILESDPSYLLTNIPIGYSEQDPGWGRIRILTSKSEITKLTNRLKANLLTTSLLISLLSFVSTLLVLSLFTWSGFKLVPTLIRLMKGDFESQPARVVSFLWSPLLSLFSKASREIISLRGEVERRKVDNAITEIATQVSHDIRSPLSALNMVVGLLHDLSEEKRLILRSATQRINDIANQLLQKGAGNQSSSEPVMLVSLVDSIVSEKRAQFSDKIYVDIQADLGNGYGLFANVAAPEISRAISNLINNAVEAISGPGNVTVGLNTNDNKAKISITDNGKGISNEVLNRLGERGFSHGKNGTQSGSGLGIYHARTVMEQSQGNCTIESIVGRGTTVTLDLPLAPAPWWFVEKLTIEAQTTIVSLDDDHTIHQIWSGRLNQLSLKNNVAKHLSFTSIETFNEWVRQNSHGKALFLIDYEFIGQHSNGLDVIELFGLANQSVLVTSRFNEADILARAKMLNVKILPKSLTPHIPISFS